MKKTFAFVAAVAMILAITASAKTSAILFNRYQFQPYEYTCDMDGVIEKMQLTVPFVYKGSLAVTDITTEANGTELWTTCELDDDCKGTLIPKEDRTKYCFVVATDKQTLPLFMTICQPCIDCFPCDYLQKEATEYATAAEFEKFSCEAEIGKITRWNLYVIKDGILNKINLVAEDDANFFTGKKGTAPAVLELKPIALFLQGKKSNFTFKYTEAFLNAASEWENEGGYKTATAYVKSLASMTGTTAIVDPDNMIVKTMSFKLTRDASLTKNAVKGAFTATMASKGKGWEDCNLSEEAGICEKYFTVDDEMDEDDKYLDQFDAYLKATYKKSITLAGSLDAVFAVETKESIQ